MSFSDLLILKAASPAQCSKRAQLVMALPQKSSGQACLHWDRLIWCEAQTSEVQILNHCMHDIDTQVPSTLIVCALLAALAKPGLQISNHIEGPPMFFTRRGDCLERLQNNGHFAFHPSHWLPIGRPVFCRFSQCALEDNDHHSRGEGSSEHWSVSRQIRWFAHATPYFQ